MNQKNISRRTLLLVTAGLLSGAASARGGGRGGGRGRGGWGSGRGSGSGMFGFLLFIGSCFGGWWLIGKLLKRRRTQEESLAIIRSRALPAAPRDQTVTIQINQEWERLGLCPKCGSKMRKRLAKRGRNSGKAFMGCSKYPNCYGIRKINNIY